jgi:hypothetical protein
MELRVLPLYQIWETTAQNFESVTVIVLPFAEKVNRSVTAENQAD